MKIISLNINGLKAFYNRGDGEGSLLQKLIDNYNPDIILFQETKCSNEDFRWWLSDYAKDFYLYNHQNQYSKGYAGVGAMVSKKLTPGVACPIMINSEYDTGRVIQLRLPDMYVIGVYVLNSGDKDDLRQEWNKEFTDYLRTLDKPYVVLGDFNVCSRPEDCWAYEQYFDNMPGVMGYEIEHFHSMLKELDLIDTWLELHPNQTDTYSWFSYRGASRYKNQGLRLDYAIASKEFKDKILSCEILGKPIEYSDHSPILIEF